MASADSLALQKLRFQRLKCQFLTEVGVYNIDFRQPADKSLAKGAFLCKTKRHPMTAILTLSMVNVYIFIQKGHTY